MSAASVLPQDLDAEESLLGAMMLKPAAIDAVRHELDADDFFYREKHGRIFEAIVALHERGEPTEALVVADELERRGYIEDVGGRVRLHELAGRVPATANAPHYARLIRTAALRRRLLAELGPVVGSASNGTFDKAQAAEAIERAGALIAQDVRSVGHSQRLRFLPGADFLSQEIERRPALLGRQGDVLLPAGGLCILAGDGGAGKSTLSLHAVAHLASGTDWFGLGVPRPLRVGVIENEGPKEPFIAKVQRFADNWPGPDFLGNCFFQDSPWGSFSLADEGLRSEIRSFVADERIDLVVAGPLGELGVEGVGSPEETRVFLELLVATGYKTACAWWLLHHLNRQKQLSGDWRGHPDLILEIEQEGRQRRSKLSFTKVRYGDQGRKPLILEWLPEVEGIGYRSVELPEREDVDWPALRERVVAFVRAHAECSQRAVEKGVPGRAGHIREALDQLVASGDVTDVGSVSRRKFVVTESASRGELEWR